MKSLPYLKPLLLPYLLGCYIFILLINPVQAKKRCKPFLEKLHNVQSMQRNSYSFKRGQSLRVKEDKARDKWWKCEQSSRYAKSNKKGNKKNSNKKSSKKKSNNKSITMVKYKPNRVYTNKNSSAAPFSGIDTIVIKSKYQGEKTFDWLNFYQQPVKCKRPKKLTIFAACNEDKRAQQLKFEQQYHD